MLFSHIVVGSNDLKKSVKFYNAIFAVIGVSPVKTDAKGRPFYEKDDQRLVITKPIDGKPATYANGGTIGLFIDSPQKVDEWYKAGVANGGTAIEDPPGIRKKPDGDMYLAYLRDPDGNKLCGFCRL